MLLTCRVISSLAKGADAAEDPDVPLEVLHLIVQPPVLLDGPGVLVSNSLELLNLYIALSDSQGLEHEPC